MDYSQLPDDIIEKIARDHLPPTDAQLITLPAVCKSWRSVLRRGSPRIPGLLSSPALGSRYCTAVHKFVPLTCNILAGTKQRWIIAIYANDLTDKYVVKIFFFDDTND
ncbi:hypothetical protein LINGRAHAP2_LOCUS13163 [Linum grandiflorum]